MTFAAALVDTSGNLFIGLNGRLIACQRIDWQASSSLRGSGAKVYLADLYFGKDRPSISYPESDQAIFIYASLIVWVRAHCLSFVVHHFSRPYSKRRNITIIVFVNCKLGPFQFSPLWPRRLFWPNPSKMILCGCGFDRQNGSSRPLLVLPCSLSVWLSDTV